MADSIDVSNSKSGSGICDVYMRRKDSYEARALYDMPGFEQVEFSRLRCICIFLESLWVRIAKRQRVLEEETSNEIPKKDRKSMLDPIGLLWCQKNVTSS